MYIKSINIHAFRTFRETQIDLLYQGKSPTKGLPVSNYPNINVILGTNGLGKTTLLKAIALTALGPAVSDSGLYPYHLVRKEPENNQAKQQQQARLKATFQPHSQDNIPSEINFLEAEMTITKKGDLEQMRWTHEDEKLWHPIFLSSSDAFFFVGYGTTRRVEKKETLDLGSRSSSSFARAQRVKSLFEEAYSLVPLNAWLPNYESTQPKRFKEVVNIINRVMGQNHYQLTGKLETGEYLFEKNGLQIPFPALSDGYRAFLGWIGDLLFHICTTCPSSKKLLDHKGMVMVDEIDLHLHPEWQKSILPTLAKELPNIQFIVTTHSPLIVGSVEWMNIINMVADTHEASKAKRIKYQIKGLDADQILISDFFGLETTRTDERAIALKKLTLKTRTGNTQAAKELLNLLANPSKNGTDD